MFENGLSLTMLPSGYHDSKADTHYNLREDERPWEQGLSKIMAKNNKAETQPTMGLAPRSALKYLGFNAF